MREITTHKDNGCNDAIVLTAEDGPGPGGASHLYCASVSETLDVWLRFQNGPVGEVGANGITHEVLLAILIDRLQGFQQGPYRCEENAEALTHLLRAQATFHARTLARVRRGVEGTHQV